MSIVDVPVTRPDGKGARRMHPHLVSIADASVESTVLVAEDEHHSIVYRHHGGILYRTASKHEFVYGHLRRSMEPITIADLRAGAEWLSERSEADRSKVGVSHLAPVLHLHRLFTELRSLRDRAVGQFETGFSSERETNASTVAAERLASKMLFVDGVLHVPSLPPVAKVSHDYHLNAHVVPTHPDFVEYELAGRLRDPRIEWIDGKRDEKATCIFGPGDKLTIHRDDLLPYGAIEAYDAERMAWVVLARLAECRTSSFGREHVRAFGALRNRLVQRARSAGLDATKAQRYPYGCETLQFEDPRSIDDDLMRLKSAFVPRSKAKTKAETADASSWFDVRRSALVEDAAALEDFVL